MDKNRIKDKIEHLYKIKREISEHLEKIQDEINETLIYYDIKVRIPMMENKLINTKWKVYQIIDDNRCSLKYIDKKSLDGFFKGFNDVIYCNKELEMHYSDGDIYLLGKTDEVINFVKEYNLKINTKVLEKNVDNLKNEINKFNNLIVSLKIGENND